MPRIKGLAGSRERGGEPAPRLAVQDEFQPLEWLERWPDVDILLRPVFAGRALDRALTDEFFRALCVRMDIQDTKPTI